MGMPPPVPTVYCCVRYPGRRGYPGEVLLGRGGVCVVSGIGIKRKFLGRGYPKRGYSGK